MTDAEIDAIERRAKAATEGPWLFSSFTVTSPAIGNGICEVFERAADGAFIAYAREDVPALVAEVRRLDSLNGALVGILAAHGFGLTTDRYAEAVREYAGGLLAAEAEVRRLRDVAEAAVREAARVEGVRLKAAAATAPP